ncbi:MAG: RNA-directed DNA polymerase [Verrucomicrobia bacterium]|nr:RNA-directed DNA polymerase [Verrucomicrobiota bacterium]MCH8513651.1 RNA-directed DNA polymerase [Kiritimatiellia bacterium]
MSKLVELGGFTLDMGMVVRQLKQDLRDDWYPDPLNYEDLLTPDISGGILESSFENHHGQFVPEERLELNIPKRGFVLRYSLEMSPKDRLYYQALVGYLVPYYDPLLPNQILNHRHAIGGNRAGRYLFKQPIEQWGHFQGYVREEAKARPVVLITDVQNYYENISVEKILKVLESNVSQVKADGAEKARIRRIIEELNRCLANWCYTPAYGLPQNRDASSFLANLVMLPVDQAMLKRGYGYFRYMDDIRITTGSRYEARAALQDLTMELRKLGLNVNGQKTKIWEPKDDGYHEALGKNTPLLAQIDSMWRSKSLPVIRRSFKPLQTLAQQLIQNGETQERAFRFCMKRFENLALCPELGVPKAFFDPLADLCIRQLDAQPFSSDQIVRFLKAVPTSNEQMKLVASLLADEKRAVYDWQKYLLWQLLVHKKYHDPNMLLTAKMRMESTTQEADRAGAVHYLGAMGDQSDRQGIAKMFKNFNNHLVQRNALIAIHEVKYSEGIKQNVVKHVLPSLKGTYQRVRDGFMSQYYRPLPPISALNIYDEMSPYD